MTIDNIKHLNMMIKQIDLFQKKELKLIFLVEKLWGLYELIEDTEKTDKFKNDFHKYWDYLEEIIAVNKIKEYELTIKNEIIPNFKSILTEYVNNPKSSA